MKILEKLKNDSLWKIIDSFSELMRDVNLQFKVSRRLMDFKKDKKKSMVYHFRVKKFRTPNTTIKQTRKKERLALKEGQLGCQLTSQQLQWKPEISEIISEVKEDYVIKMAA